MRAACYGRFNSRFTDGNKGQQMNAFGGKHSYISNDSQLNLPEKYVIFILVTEAG